MSDRVNVEVIKHFGRYFHGDKLRLGKGRADELVRQGKVRIIPEEKDEAAAVPPPAPSDEAPSDEPEASAPDEEGVLDPAELDDDALKEHAKEAGIKFAHVMKRETILAKLAELSKDGEAEE